MARILDYDKHFSEVSQQQKLDLLCKFINGGNYSYGILVDSQTRWVFDELRNLPPNSFLPVQINAGPLLSLRDVYQPSFDIVELVNSNKIELFVHLS